MSFLLPLFSRVSKYGCLFRLRLDAENIFGGHRGRGESPGCPPFRPSPRDERRSAAGRMVAYGAADLLLADLRVPGKFVHFYTLRSVRTVPRPIGLDKSQRLSRGLRAFRGMKGPDCLMQA